LFATAVNVDPTVAVPVTATDPIDVGVPTVTATEAHDLSEATPVTEITTSPDQDVYVSPIAKHNSAEPA
jgi:hypothetical protein